MLPNSDGPKSVVALSVSLECYLAYFPTIDLCNFLNTYVSYVFGLRKEGLIQKFATFGNFGILFAHFFPVTKCKIVAPQQIRCVGRRTTPKTRQGTN